MTNILDEFNTGPVEGLMPIKMRDPNHLQLTAQDKVTLVQHVHSPAYQVYLKLAEGVLEEMETAHFQVWKDKEAFERTGLFAVAARIFMERLGADMQRHVEEFAGEVEFAKTKKEVLEKSPEEQIQEEFK